jgi:hypothetical protein
LFRREINPLDKYCPAVSPAAFWGAVPTLENRVDGELWGPRIAYSVFIPRKSEAGIPEASQLMTTAAAYWDRPIKSGDDG